MGFYLHNLKNILTYHADLISGAADEFEKLKNEVVLMKAILQDASRERYHGEVLKLWHAEMREVVCDAEDLIDLCCNYSTAQVTREPSIFHGSSPWKIRLHLAEEVNEFRRGKVRRVLDIMFQNGFLFTQSVSNDMADQDTLDWIHHEFRREMVRRVLDIMNYMHAAHYCSISIPGHDLLLKLYASSVWSFEAPLYFFFNCLR